METMEDDCDEDVVFENSPLHQHLQSVGMDVQPEPVASTPTHDLKFPAVLHRDGNGWKYCLADAWGVVRRLCQKGSHSVLPGQLYREQWAEQCSRRCLLALSQCSNLEDEDLAVLENYVREDDRTPTSSPLLARWPLVLVSCLAVGTAVVLGGEEGVGHSGLGGFGPVALASTFLALVGLDSSLSFWHWWRHRQAEKDVRRLLSVVESMAKISRSSIRLIQEMELVAHGFTLVAHRSAVAGLELSRGGLVRQCPELRRTLFMVLRDCIMETREATATLIHLHPLSPELDSMLNYLSGLSLSDYGPCLQVVPHSPHGLQRIAELTDGFSIAALKGMLHLCSQHLSELLRRLALCFAPEAHSSFSKQTYAGRALADTSHLVQEATASLTAHEEVLSRSYHFHRSPPITSTPRRHSHGQSGVAPHHQELHSTLHSLDLHLQAAWTRVRQLANQLEGLPADSQTHAPTSQANAPASQANAPASQANAAARRNAVEGSGDAACRGSVPAGADHPVEVPAVSGDAAQKHGSPSEHDLELALKRVKDELDACRACWEDSMARLDSRATTSVHKLDDSSPGKEGHKEEQTPAQPAPEYIVQDQVFEAYTDPDEMMSADYGWEPILSPEERDKKKREREEAMRMLNELKSVISSRARDMFLREQAALQRMHQPTPGVLEPVIHGQLSPDREGSKSAPEETEAEWSDGRTKVTRADGEGQNMRSRPCAGTSHGMGLGGSAISGSADDSDSGDGDSPPADPTRRKATAVPNCTRPWTDNDEGTGSDWDDSLGVKACGSHSAPVLSHSSLLQDARHLDPSPNGSCRSSGAGPGLGLASAQRRQAGEQGVDAARNPGRDAHGGDFSSRRRDSQSDQGAGPSSPPLPGGGPSLAATVAAMAAARSHHFKMQEQTFGESSDSDIDCGDEIENSSDEGIS